MDNHQCANCGAIFNGRKRRYCTKQCAKRYGNRKRRGYDLSEFEPVMDRTPTPAAKVNCLSCGSEFKPKQNPTGAVSADRTRENKWQRYCSRKCAWHERSLKTKLKEEILSIKRLGAPLKNTNVQRMRDRKHEYALANHCRKCGNVITQKNHQNCKRFCDDCRMVARKDRRNSEDHKEYRNKYRRDQRSKGLAPNGHDRSRAKFYGVPYEPIKRAKVFDLYKWKCAECGVDTPFKNKGTLKDDAPELDHIVPISKGGPHLYSNVQLLCRKCNADKSSDRQVLV